MYLGRIENYEFIKKYYSNTGFFNFSFLVNPDTTQLLFGKHGNTFVRINLDSPDACGLRIGTYGWWTGDFNKVIVQVMDVSLKKYDEPMSFKSNVLEEESSSGILRYYYWSDSEGRLFLEVGCI